MEARQQILSGITQWVSTKVDELASDNILLTLGSRTIKRVIVDMIDNNLSMDLIGPLMSNHGVVDAELMANEIIPALRVMPKTKIPIYGSMYATVGEGVISVYLPDNNTINTLMKGITALHFKEEDITELAQYINNAKNQ